MPSEPTHRVSQRPFEAVASAEEGCGLIAYGQFDSLNHSEIRRIPCSRSLSGGRLPAVFSEGGDPCPSEDPESYSALKRVRPGD
jgi:hypothetical protein